MRSARAFWSSSGRLLIREGVFGPPAEEERLWEEQGRIFGFFSEGLRDGAIRLLE